MSPKVPGHAIVGAQHFRLYEKMHFPTCPKAKVGHMWHPGTSRAQPRFVIYDIYALFNRSGSPERFSRIVTLSSEAHVPGTINVEDLQSEYVN